MKKWRVKTGTPGKSHAPLEHLVELVLNGSSRGFSSAAGAPELAREFLDFDARGTRVVVLGGGTGLSTVVGGDSQMPDWPDRPFVGLKQEFPRLDVVVVTTDDGGSTGLLRRQLPLLGVGDLRKSCLSLIESSRLRRAWRLDERNVRQVVRLIQGVFNHRFPAGGGGLSVLKNPLRAVPSALRRRCPPGLASALSSLGSYVSPGGSGPTIKPAGHCLGNLILTAAIFKAAGGRTARPPGLTAIQTGLDEVARLIGVKPGRLHPATATPGQLLFRYANGVEVYGQRKATRVPRGFPVERIGVEFAGYPAVTARVRRAIREADLIIYAPGSLYSSMIPLLQIKPILDAIRANRKALKILAANFWIQEGETDISPGSESRGFLVSEIIDAYRRNVARGDAGLFDIVLSANLENIPGHILRNYALEGKMPIHLDRARVEKMGLQPVEATLFSLDRLMLPAVIHHDAENFARAVRVLCYARRFLPETIKNAGRARAKKHLNLRTVPSPPVRPRRRPLVCEYISSIRKALAGKRFRPEKLKEVMIDLAWENRDIRPSHLNFFSGARVVSAARWDRSTEWDNVLGYYDPRDRRLKIHEQLLADPDRLREDLLIALGESLLGRYIEAKRFLDDAREEGSAGRRYEIRLRPARERECFLSDPQLRAYLKLARMVPDPGDRRVYRIVINDNEGFLPPGLLFGLLYAWYLNKDYGGVMEYEMSLLRWRPGSLIPYQAKERIRKQRLIAFFRTEIFGHTDI